MRLEVIVAALVALAGVAGCIEAPEGEQTVAAAAASGPVLEELGAIDATGVNTSAEGAWFVVPLSIASEGGLTAFEWTIPTGALVPWGYNEVFDEDEKVVAIEIALLSAGSVESWGMVLFEDGQNGLETAGGYLSFASTGTFYTTLESRAMDEEVRTTDFSTFGFELEEGQLLHGLVFARGEPAEAAVGFRVLDHDPYDPDSEDEPADSPTAFVSSRENAPPLALATLATAKGVELHGYFDALIGGIGATQPYFGFESIIGAPDVAWDTAPQDRAMGGRHVFQGSIDGTLPRGYDVVDASYFSVDVGTLSYTADIVHHGEAYSAAGDSVELGMAGLFVGASMAGGWAYAWGDGEGETSTQLALDRTLVRGEIAFASLSLLEFGATIDELFGKSAEGDGGAGEEGMSFPPVLTSRGVVLQRSDGAMWTYALPGAAALQNL